MTPLDHEEKPKKELWQRETFVIGHGERTKWMDGLCVGFFGGMAFWLFAFLVSEIMDYVW